MNRSAEFTTVEQKILDAVGKRGDRGGGLRGRGVDRQEHDAMIT
jgi:hypothetical protein